jgi:hypothetical protein
VLYDADAPLHDRYTMTRGFAAPAELQLLRDLTLTINAFFGWDFNSCESLRSGGRWIPIDFANPCPDSQVTSLHYHFPWLIKANLRWSVFCAATKRPMRKTLDWEPFFDACQAGMTPEERIRACGGIAKDRLDAARFEAFCAEHLPHLDEVADEFFRGPEARDAIRQKVAALFPEHEIDEFTGLFFERVQRACAEEPPGSLGPLAS